MRTPDTIIAASLVLALGSPARAVCPEHEPGVERLSTGRGVRLQATSRVTALSDKPESIATARVAAKLAALALLDGERDVPRHNGGLLGIVPVSSCTNGLEVFETLAVDAASAGAASSLANDLGRSLADHSPASRKW